MKPAPFDYVAAHSASEAVEALARHGEDAKVLAGGQSLLPMLNMRLARPAVVVDVNGAADLDYVRQSNGTLAVGAVTRQRAVERWAGPRAPLLAAALRAVGHVAIRTRGTVAGSVAHADPASELPALLLALDGEVTARSARGERTIEAAELFLAPLTTSLAEGELVTEVRFRLPEAGTGWGFAEVARRHGDFALVGAVSLLSLGGDGKATTARLAFFGVGGTPQRGAGAEAALAGQEPTRARIEDAARVAAAALSPEADLHATAEYRRRAGSRPSVSSSMSTKTGVAPSNSRQLLLATKLKGVVITSSPGPMPRARTARCSPAVPLLTAMPWRRPASAATRSSNSAVNGPMASVPLVSTWLTSSCSSAPMFGCASGTLVVEVGPVEVGIGRAILPAVRALTDPLGQEPRVPGRLAERVQDARRRAAVAVRGGPRQAGAECRGQR